MISTYFIIFIFIIYLDLHYILQQIYKMNLVKDITLDIITN